MDTLRKYGKKRAMEEHTATVIRHAAHLENGLDWFNDEPRDPAVPPYVIWVVGPPGAGKSRWVYDTFGSSNVYNAPATLNWFDGYQQQRVLLLDDFRDDWPGSSWSYFLRLLDRYPMKIPRKGGFRELNSPYIVITSVLHPNQFFTKIQENRFQLYRRITI